ncbi:TPA: hypothetical protein EYP75_06260 [Candidatus Bathyarchaeota archaeon]|nr:hypothetical protein [Candidatus Bathyarchaeota archaeon]
MISQPFFEEYMFFVALTLLSVFSGLLIRLSMLALRASALQKRVFVLDELIGHLLIRKNSLQTFIRISLWNMMVSSLVIISGAVTFGVLPLIWAFLNLGLFFPDLNLFRAYLYPWVEEAANILSTALGIWIGRNLYAFPIEFPFFLWTVIIIFGLYMASSLLETLKIHNV